ncbi:MarR family winged helix-turn-helix transcriptional regulator [Methylobacterium oxalidis]|uniref:MarR family transcriptional regulator n=2 Tax=Methylobacterium oxalidis TaxID=944322 RepID=A0A512J2T2_9HYPH|nr:MarR family winged helix-turn-helix transcriptional regulator [Methylobacterium oxalidis]GEP04169.1 MarR family transcriptional regulator [Methylobacterium oxalidis]GLS66703.1 MarR family transcriptional regulator [Methylobacterium oxalidis]
MEGHPTLTPCHCLAVRQAARHVTQLYDRHLAASGLRATQFALLSTLDRMGSLAVHELAGHLVMDRTATGRALRPLERDGLIAIGAGRDARTRALSLTPAGRERLEAARPLWQRAQAAFRTEYGEADALALQRALGRVIGRRPVPEEGAAA